MSSGVPDVFVHDGARLMEEPDAQMVAPNDRQTDQPQHNVLDESEPEFVSESDEDDDLFFKPSPPLPSPVVIKRTLKELRDLMNTPYLDLDSSEHRPRRYEGTDGLIGIIDSLSQKYDFPPIYFNQKQVRGPDGSIQYNRICIDGLKRLFSIKAFMEGDIPCHDHRRRKWYYGPRSNKGSEAQTVDGRRYLPDDVKEDFANMHFVCHEFEDLNGAEGIELRARVHLGSTLTPGEKLRATMIFSEDLMMDFAKLLGTDFQSISELADSTRSKGFQNLMKCSSQILEMQKALSEKRQPVLRISDTALNGFVRHADASTLETVTETLKFFNMLVTMHPEEFRSFPEIPFSSMEMVAIASLTFKYYKSIKPWVFIRFIGSLRTSLHNITQHHGILQTRQNWQHAWDWIQGFEKFVKQGEALDVTSAAQLGTPNNALNNEDQKRLPTQHQSFAGEIEHPSGSRASSATFISSPNQFSALKRKGSPHPLDPAKKRVHLPTPVSPALIHSPRVSLRAASPDSVLGSDGSEDEREAEASEKAIQKDATPAQEAEKSISPEPAQRRLVRSTFKTKSDFVPHHSESPTTVPESAIAKPNGSALSALIASVPAPSPKKLAPSSPAGLNIQFGVSQIPAIKPSLLYSLDTKKMVPYQSNAAASPSLHESDGVNSAADVERGRKSRSPTKTRLVLQSASRPVTPINQSPNLGGAEAPTLPPYSGRGRPRKYPPKSVTPEGLSPKKRGRPRKDSETPDSGPPREQAYGIRGRGRKSIPGSISTRITTSHQTPSEMNTPSLLPQQKPNQAPPQHSITPSPPRRFSRLSGRPRKDLIPSSTPSTKSPSPPLRDPNFGAHKANNELWAKSITSRPSDLTAHETDQAPKALDPAISSTSKQVGGGNGEMPSQPPLSTPKEIGQVSQPLNSSVPTPKLPPPIANDVIPETKPNGATPVASDREPSAPVTVQSRSVSISSSREPSVSRFSATGSLTNATPRTTPDPSLIDAKPFIGPSKLGGAKALAERRRQQQLELQERKKRLQAETAAALAIELNKSKD